MSEKSYPWNAAEYARNSTGQLLWAQELIEKLRLQGSERVLDIGCGDGKVTAAIAQRVPHGLVTGIDRSWPMVAFARRSFGEVPNLWFAQMDAAWLSFQPFFDVAFSNAALHWVKDHRAVLEGVTGSLKPGGRLLFQMGGRGNAEQIVIAMDIVRKRPAWKSCFTEFTFPYGFYGVEEYERLLAETGLRAERIDLLCKDMQHAGREGLAGWIRTAWMPYTTRVPEARREAFISDVVDTYLLDHPADAQGIVHVQMMRLEVEAGLH